MEAGALNVWPVRDRMTVSPVLTWFFLARDLNPSEWSKLMVRVLFWCNPEPNMGQCGFFKQSRSNAFNVMGG
jgi:hypothetical protein